ncbi:MAG: hypothetical protein ABSG89_01055 [Bacteroidales bacterium]|jgi:hypothetical protein
MDFNSTVDLIIRDLDQTLDIIDDFRNYPGVPVLQVELAKSKCRSAAEIIALLKNARPDGPEDANKEIGPDKIEKKKEPVKKPHPGHKDHTHFMPQSPHTVPAAQNENPDENVTIAETFVSQAGSLYEQLGDQGEGEIILDSIKSKPIASLSDAIGVNDRFLFIKEIFDGNTETYNRVIKKLDDAGTFADARAIIMDNIGEAAGSEAAGQLLDLIRRKFPQDE